MENGLHGANGLPVGQSAHIGVVGTVQTPHLEMEEKTAMVLFYSQKTALMDYVC